MSKLSIPRPSFRTLIRVLAVAVILLAVLTLAGWISGLTLLASVRARYIPMAPTTALCFALVGIGLLIRLERPAHRLIPTILGSVALLVACAKLAELATGKRFGIDALFVPDPTFFGRVLTGRMSPITAANFVFTTVGLITLGHPRWNRMAGPLGAMTTLVSGVVLIGYSYGTPLLYGGSIIPVAFTTATAFFLCGILIMALAGDKTWPLGAFMGDSTRALLLRALVPATVAATLVIGWSRTLLLSSLQINPAALSAISALVQALLITWIISKVSGIVGGRIDHAEAERNRAQEELVELNSQLEQRVRDRTAELRGKNEQMEEELQMARELQYALLPHQFPCVPSGAEVEDSALRFLSFYYPTGDVSGDFFTVFPLGENAVGIFICDVMGHGVRAALITSMIRGLVEEHVQDATDPGKMLCQINRRLVGILKQSATTMFATGFYLVIDVERAQLRFASAGHPPPIHLDRGGNIARSLRSNGNSGPAMGLFSEAKYGTTDTTVRGGDLIMLYTDGLFEVEDSDGNTFTEEELLATANRHSSLPPHEMIAKVVEEIRGISPKHAFDDDVCVVGVQVQHVG